MYAIFDQHSAINNLFDHRQDGRLKLKDDKVGAGANLGILYEFSPCTRVGIQYLSKVAIRFKPKTELAGVGPILHEILRLSGVLNSRVRLKVNVPSNLMVSGYHLLTPCLAVMANFGWQQWSNFGKVEIALANSSARSLTFSTKYLDTYHVAFGTKYAIDPALDLLCGIAYDTTAVTKKNRTFTFPVGHQWRFGTGAQYRLWNDVEVTAAYELLWQGQLPVTVSRGNLGGTVSGRYQASCTHFIDVGMKWYF
jgi:long-chain fatty acid transport protein